MVSGRSFRWAFALLLAVAPTVAAQVTPDPRVPGTGPASAAARQFPADARIGLVDFTRVAAVSASGKALSTRIEAFRSKKSAEVQARSKDVASLEGRLTQNADLLNAAAREQLRRQFERAEVDFQRFSQDVEAEVQQVQRELEQSFLEKARPIVEAVAREKSLWAVLSMGESGLVWWDPALDLSDEIAKRIDATAAP